MTWLITLPALLLTVAGAQEVQQSPLYAAAPEGASVHIACLTRGALDGLYLERTWPGPANVIYYEDGRAPTVDRRFRGRIHFSGTQNNLSISVSRLAPNDSGVYACKAVSERSVRSRGTMVTVTGKPSQGACACREARPTWAAAAGLAVAGLLSGLGLGTLCLRTRAQVSGSQPPAGRRPRGKPQRSPHPRPTVRKLSGATAPPCVVYEDMSFSRGDSQRR
ncbi:T-cell antigen CD7 [Perognathus longimembris pacificus]|uniref:T-cell antigen CD7 n=1 Tax=Perognathus longimembris pacificus TaxID=214514 RepID=UPI002019EF89|nr:T-cell antigen CD7 [Perognathus longimembris pacificus]